MAKVSFDFDSTLSRSPVQDYAKKLVQEGHDVWLVTSRFTTEEAIKRWIALSKAGNDFNVDLHKVCDSVGIALEKRLFTNMTSKWPVLQEEGFLWHLDDDGYELLEMRENAISTIGINVTLGDWKERCEELLNEKT